MNWRIFLPNCFGLSSSLQVNWTALNVSIFVGVEISGELAFWLNNSKLDNRMYRYLLFTRCKYQISISFPYFAENFVLSFSKATVSNIAMNDISHHGIV